MVLSACFVITSNIVPKLLPNVIVPSLFNFVNEEYHLQKTSH